MVSTPPLCVHRWLGSLRTCLLQLLASQAAAAENDKNLRLSLVVAFFPTHPLIPSLLSTARTFPSLSSPCPWIGEVPEFNHDGGEEVGLMEEIIFT